MRMNGQTAGLVAAMILGVAAGGAFGAINGSDNVDDPAYAGGLADGINGGSGFLPWTLASNATANGYAGFYAGAPSGIDNIASPSGNVWASYANKGDGVDQATAYRGFAESLDGLGDSFSISLENGFVNGTAGFALRSGNVTTTAGDFSTDARMELQLNGGDATYTLVDADGEYDTGVGFSFFGIDATVRMTGADTYDIDILRYNEPNDPNPQLTTITGRTLAGSGTLDSVAIYNQDTETQSDAFFNNLGYTSGINSGSDTTLNPDYDFGWYDATGDIGTGLGPWDFTYGPSANGFAGFFLQDNPGNGIDNVGQPTPQDGSAWALYANKGDGVDSATAYRTFDDPLSAGGDSFTVAFENGFVDTNGKVGFALRNGNTTDLTDDYNTDARLEFYFNGGDGSFTLVDAGGAFDTGVPFTFFGVEVTVTLTGADTYDIEIKRFDEADDATPEITTITGRTFAGAGTIDSMALFNRDAATQSDLFFNSLGIVTDAPVGIPGDLNGDGYVGLDDLQFILDHWNQNVTIGDATMGDVSGPGGVPDGYVGLDDLQPILDHWNEGVLNPIAVPEPAGLVLLGLGGMAALRRRP